MEEKRNSGTTIGFHFAGLDKAQTNAMRARLNAAARQLGYVSRTGRSAGRGNAAALFVAIANGEVALLPRERQETTQETHRDSSTPAA